MGLCKCDKCLKEFKTKAGLNSHKNWCDYLLQKEKQRKDLSCKKCCKEFNTKQGLGIHTRYCGQPSNRKQVTETYNCKQCGQPSLYGHTKTNQFCSSKCGNLYKSQQLNSDPSYHKRVRARANESWARYQARKLNQTPPDANLQMIQQFYEKCPQGYEVDHITPISKGGLHHQDNLQYLTISENRSKGNKLGWSGCSDSN